EPAVVIGGEGDRAIADLRLDSQESFGNVRHADEVGARAAEKETLGPGTEPWPFDTGVGFVLVDRRTEGTGDSGDEIRGRAANRLCGRDVSDDAPTKEAGGPRPFREVDILQWQRDVPGTDLLAEAADRRDPDDGPGADTLQRPDVGAEIDL